MTDVNRFYVELVPYQDEQLCVLASDFDLVSARVTQLEAEAVYTAAGVADDQVRIDTLRTANQRLEGEVARLREALGEAADYLSDNQYNEICSGSQLHRKMRAALDGKGGDA